MDEKNTPKPKPTPKKVEAVEVYDAVLEEIEEVPVEVEEPEAEVVQPKSAPSVPLTTYAVVGKEDKDPVMLSKCVQDKMHRKSLSVHHLQRRLNEWGYTDSFTDRDGFYGAGTQSAVAKFQHDKGIKSNGRMDEATLRAIFEGDTNVRVVID